MEDGSWSKEWEKGRVTLTTVMWKGAQQSLDEPKWFCCVQVMKGTSKNCKFLDII
jgi:hypothetical protein